MVCPLFFLLPVQENQRRIEGYLVESRAANSAVNNAVFGAAEDQSSLTRIAHPSQVVRDSLCCDELVSDIPLSAGTYNAILQSTRFVNAAIAQNIVNTGTIIGNVRAEKNALLSCHLRAYRFCLFVVHPRLIGVTCS